MEIQMPPRSIFNGESLMITESSNWVFTTWDVPEVNPKITNYLIYQEEKCPETGRIHYQGYAEFKRSYNMGQVKRNFKTKKMYVMPAMFSRDINKLYCHKSKTFTGKLRIEYMMGYLVDGGSTSNEASPPKTWADIIAWDGQ